MTKCFQSSYIPDIHLFSFLKWRNGEAKIKVYTRKKKRSKKEGDIKEPKVMFI